MSQLIVTQAIPHANGPEPLVTFVIPVRHPANARDWPGLKQRLSQTVASISAQTHPSWRAVIVANAGSDLPELPGKVGVEWVDFPPNPYHERRRGKTTDTFLDAFRFDKGRRVLAGMLAARDSRFFMIVDDDDLVSRGIVSHVALNPTAPGWKIEWGYIWNSDTRLLMATREFNRLCGTSLIVRSDLYELPASASEASKDWIMDMLGSHRRIAPVLEKRGAPLELLPFPGAIYRVASKDSHSGTPSFLVKYKLNRKGLFDSPSKFMRAALSIRLAGGWSRREFGLRLD